MLKKYVYLMIMICAISIVQADSQYVKGVNRDIEDLPKGQKPYEMAQRQEARTPLVTFDDCTKWTLKNDGVEAALYRTQEQKLYRDYCGKILYKATDDKSEIFVKLNDPVVIPEPWDCVQFWDYGPIWMWQRPVQKFFKTDIVIEDANGKRHNLPFNQTGYAGNFYKYWFLNRSILTEEIARPARFIGIRYHGQEVTDQEPYKMFLGPVYFYKEKLSDLKFNDYPSKLPFPTREETILPINKNESFTNNVSKSKDHFKFSYTGSDCTLTYLIEPNKGIFDGIAVEYEGQRIKPCDDGHFKLIEVYAKDALWSLENVQLQSKALKTRWMVSAGSRYKTFDVEYKIMQKSLVMEIIEDDSSAGIVTAIDTGHTSNIKNPKLYEIPFLVFNYATRPMMLTTDKLFFFNQFDWYFSDASRLYVDSFTVTDTTARHNGGAEYKPKTDGSRNPVKERLFINISNDAQEVLPFIPNPASPMRSVQADRAWLINGSPDYVGVFNQAKLYRAYGLDKVTVRYHEDFWRDGGESYTFRIDAAPGRGGNKAVYDCMRNIQSLGWRVGLYTNYTDFATVNANWNEDWILRDSKGRWQTSWARCYAPKPMKGLEVQREYAPKIYQSMGPNHSYNDVATAVSPFSRVDYDSRVPGAGTFRRTFECYGQILLNEKRAYKGPVYSEGANHWWYAGLVDGNYANCANLDKGNIFPDFHLLMINPLEMDAGNVYGDIDRYLALTLAYGNIVKIDGSNEDVIKRYYMINPLQKFYSMVKVRDIKYFVDGRFVDTSNALRTGGITKRRLFVEYETGYSVYVNGNEKPWTIDVDGQKIVLPKWGFYAAGKDNKYTSCSILVDGNRLEMMKSPDMFYFDTNGKRYADKDFVVNGKVAIKKETFGWEIIPATDFSEFGFRPEVFDLQGVDLELIGLKQDGGPAKGLEVKDADNGFKFAVQIEKHAFKYRIVPTIQGWF